MPPKIAFGVNLNFAKYVYGQKRAIELARDVFGIRWVEAVPDNDFGPIFYLTAPEAFRSYHWDIADHAKRLGVTIGSVLTVYRDTGAIAYPDPAIRESAYRVGLAMLEMASCYRARFASSSLFTMNRELAEDNERFQSHFDASMRIWRRWMMDAHRLRLEGMLIEIAAAYREGCSTIADTLSTLELLDQFHRENPGSTVPVGLCYDTGHGISEEESPDPRDRDFRAWFDAFPDRIHEIHLKDTDPLFQETWHFSGGEGHFSGGEGHFGAGEGIIKLHEVVEAVREKLVLPQVLMFLEVPGKRGREVGEKRSLEGHKRSIALIRQALTNCGYRENPEDGVWLPE